MGGGSCTDDLWPRILSLNNLLEAWDKVRANRGCAGVDGVTVDQFHRHRDRALRKLRASLASGHYKPLPLRAFHIPKLSGDLRTLGVPAVRDRTAQQAVNQLIGPILEHTFEPHSFGYRPRRSIFGALGRVRSLRDEGREWVLDADIDGFFDHVDHHILVERLWQWVPEPNIRRLVWQWLRSPALVADELRERNLGLPQGAVISPLMANLYLDGFDEAVCQAGFELVRYADDFVILCWSADEALRARAFVDEELARLKLRLKDAKTRITTFTQGFSIWARFEDREYTPSADEVCHRRASSEGEESPGRAWRPADHRLATDLRQAFPLGHRCLVLAAFRAPVYVCGEC